MTRYRGFYYHFLDMATGERFERVELSTIDSALLAAGALACQSYFDRDDPVEASIRADADTLYRRMEWDWASPRPPRRLDGLDARGGLPRLELARLRRGDDPVPARARLADPPDRAAPRGRSGRRPTSGASSTGRRTSTSRPSSATSTRTSGSTSAASTTRTCARRESTTSRTRGARRIRSARTRRRIPARFAGYGPEVWGLTACDGPFDGEILIGGKRRKFQGYAARGASLLHVIDDGTLSPGRGRRLRPVRARDRDSRRSWR